MFSKKILMGNNFNAAAVICNPMGFSQNGADFTEFSEFRESTEAWIRVNLTVFSGSYVCDTVVESLSHTQEGVGSSSVIQWKHLEKTQLM